MVTNLDEAALLAIRSMERMREYNAAVDSILFEVGCAVRPWFAAHGFETSSVAYFETFIGVIPEEDARFVETLRPFAERSFADPRARLIFGHLAESRLVDDLDISYPVDEIELLKDYPAAFRNLSHDAFLVLNAMSPKNIDQVDRFFRIESPNIENFQLGIIRQGVKKKFFRQAPELQWLKESRFRGLNRAIDSALDRMGM